MNKRIHILFLVCVLALLLATAVSRTIAAASAPAVSAPATTSHTPEDTPTLRLLPDCGTPAASPGPVKFHVLLEEWDSGHPLELFWDGNLLQSWAAGHNSSFSQAISQTVPQNPMTYMVTAVSGNGDSASHTFTVPCGPGAPAAPPAGRDLFTSRTQDSGIIATSNAGIFGPDICTSYGDPFSPLNSAWEPGFYTYRYRIRIPATYPHSIVRVELFNPDSINIPGSGPFTFARSQAAQNAGLPPTGSGSCSSGGGNQKNPCLVNTGELALYQNGTLPLEAINPYWFIRADENRGTAVTGQCGEPTSYTASRNTATLYQLYYFRMDGNNYQAIDLAAYTGQTADGVRDNGDHLTDLQWVSPGALQSYDYPGDRLTGVPADPGSPGDFEIDLNAELPGIVTDPQTGDRYLYLDITALSGASENGFEIWAGPPDYLETIPGEVNARNLAALNSPNSHSNQGVTVSAIQNLPLNSNFDNRLNIPLTYIGPEYAGQEVFVSLFDSDSGTQPPITFFFDSVAESDWSLTFAQPGVPDPDGEVRNCVPGSCNNLWITPPYRITIPGDLANCDYSDPQNDPDCIPFAGGRLMASYDSGMNDTYQWRVTPPTLPANDPTAGCAAFPIGVHQAAQSVTQSAYEAVIPALEHPIPPPPYSSFINHVPGIPLWQAEEGYMFVVFNGVASGSFSWLRWNEYVVGNAATLEHRLTWPGDSQDYTTVASGETPPGFPHPVYGYIEYGDPTDTEMHIGDWVAGSTGIVNSQGVHSRLVEHIDLGRVLRLPVWNDSAGSGMSVHYHMSGFALFRLAGYRLSTSSPESFLLLEFIGWDESCGQLPEPVTAVTLDGRYDAVAGVEYTFTAAANPTATLPITYVWQTDGQTITHTGGLSDSLSVAWDGLGLQPLTVTAVNEMGSAADGRVVNVLPRTDRIPGLYRGGSEIYPQSTANLALVKAASASIFGPDICTAFGDPYSPFNSPWAPGPYTFRYLIHIPGDYPHDTVRIELFDPDSINADGSGPFTINRSQIAVSQGLSPTLTTACDGIEAQRKNPCKLDTGELGLVLSGTLDFEQVNPLWMVRVDKNRGTGVPGQCGEPVSYNVTLNTQTFYELYYWQQQPGGALVRSNLAHYTGQTGDSRDDGPPGGHLTDLQWVSPGAGQSYDYPGPGVPVNAGSPGNFEIDLTAETPGILVDPVTGDRYINLDITSLSGASENSFQIWAGPPAYTGSIPGDANARNLHLLNNPQAHNPYGVAVYARGVLVQNWNLTGRFAELPFSQIPPEAAGEVVSISLFDSDSGAEPPITFFADSIARETWSLPFAVAGQPDPDGQTRNCVPGSCDNVWVSPPYAVQLPDDYPGGRIMVDYNGGLHDTATWQMSSTGRITIDGPITGTTNVTYTFLVDASYFLFTDPLTYTWEVDGYAPFTHVGGITDTVSLSWPDSGVKLMTVTIESRYFSLSAVRSHQIAIIETAVIPPDSIELSAPATAVVNEAVTVTAMLAPPNSSLPVTYTWQADEHTPIVHSGGLTDTAVFTWAETGAKTITVTAENEGGLVTTSQQILIEQLLPDLTVIGAPQMVTPLPVGAGQPVSFTVTIANSGDADVDSQFFVDIFLDPSVVLTTGIPISESSGFVAMPGLAVGESQVVTITAVLGFAGEPLTHTVYAMVDAAAQIGESDETNNVSEPLTVTDVHPLLEAVTLTGPPLGLPGETYTFTAVVTPITITDPITYTWLLDGAPALTMTNGTAVSAPFSWGATGTYTLTVLADHGFNVVSDTHTILITDTLIVDLAVAGPLQLLTPGPIRPDQPVSFTVAIQNVGNVAVTQTFEVDLTTDPDVMAATLTAVTIPGLAVGEIHAVTFTLPDGLGAGPLLRTFYAVVDAQQLVAEVDESNNISEPLTLEISWRIYLPVIRKP